ncbi:tail fiber assembly protein [Caballeronia sp. LZ028]|uniref:tail fiber assembly protein n=1 Tax=Caballeronia sp. LZ028 TaxID=3038563 RepID=UPI002859E5C9|nr:tail fiber assembly protein [Caballeronia sp. LZ028]MDR5765051.1 tail fiber assembly protein [Caballeronia sp. LZ028]
MQNLYALVDASNSVVSVILWDGDDSQWSPEEGLRAIALPEGSAVGPGWNFDGTDFMGPAPVVPNAAEILAANTATRDDLLAQAALAIGPLQDAVDLGEATAAESASLTKWKQYRVAVNRTDLTQIAPAWPAQPV